MIRKRAIICTWCEREMLIDWEASKLDRRPQILVSYCPKGHERYRSRASSPGSEGCFWKVDPVRCSVCAARTEVVHPAGQDEHLRCPNCEFYCAEVVDGDEADDEDDRLQRSGL